MHNLIAMLLLATAVSPVNPALVQRRDAIAAKLSPSAKLKLHNIADTLGRSGAITDGTSRAAIVSAFPGVNFSSADISALTFIVLMDAAESAQHDLQSITAGVSAINNQKDSLRKELGNANANKTSRVQKVYTPASTTLVVPPPLSSNATMTEKQKRLDDLSELSEMQQLKLQMVMDQKSKLEAMLSNLLQMMHDTQKSIIQNLR
jgi:hypothetical protein